MIITQKSDLEKAVEYLKTLPHKYPITLITTEGKSYEASLFNTYYIIIMSKHKEVLCEQGSTYKDEPGVEYNSWYINEVRYLDDLFDHGKSFQTKIEKIIVSKDDSRMRGLTR